jgi:predicted phosphohydrolase
MMEEDITKIYQIPEVYIIKTNHSYVASLPIMFSRILKPSQYYDIYIKLEDDKILYIGAKKLFKRTPRGHLAFVLPKPMKDFWENRKHLQAILKER